MAKKDQSRLPVNRPTALAGGLGMQAYRSPGSKSTFRTGNDMATATRNTMYGVPQVNNQAALAADRARKIAAGANVRVVPTAAVAPAPVVKNSVQRAADRVAADKNVAGPRKDSGGRNAANMSNSGGGGGGNSMQRAAARAAADRNVAGPRKDSSGRNVSSMSGKKNSGIY